MNNQKFRKIVDQLDTTKVTRTIVLQARTDIRLLANLDRFFCSQGVMVQSRNELVRLGLEVLEEYLVKLGKIGPFEEMPFHEALSQLGRLGIERDGRNKATLTAAMAKEAMLGETPSSSRASMAQFEYSQPTISEEERKKIQKETWEAYLRSQPDYVEQEGEEVYVPDEMSLVIKPKIVVEE